VIPDLFVGIQLGRIGGKAFDVKSWMAFEQTIQSGTAMNTATIPKQNDMTAQVAQQELEKGGHLEMPDVGEVEVAVEAEALAARTHRHSGDRRDLVVFLPVIEERRPSSRRPGPAHRWDQHEAALVEKNQMCAQLADFF
jgi:hypothetical protein